jgi:hypothetical protein
VTWSSDVCSSDLTAQIVILKQSAVFYAHSLIFFTKIS